MPSVNSLRSRFEPILQHPSPKSTQRVHVKQYSATTSPSPNMALRQSTLNFASRPTSTRQTAASARPRSTFHAPTPPTDDINAKNDIDIDIDGDKDTIIVDTSHSLTRPPRVSLPTPSESATDASSQTSSTPAIRSPPRSRSKRVSATRNAKFTAGTDELLVVPGDDGHGKQRNISGDTLVAGSGSGSEFKSGSEGVTKANMNLSQISLVKGSIEALDMTWNMSVNFEEQNGLKGIEEDGRSETSSTITVAVPPPSTSARAGQKNLAGELDLPERVEKKTSAASVKSVTAKEDKWEQRRKKAEKNASRKSSRASLLMGKATDVVSAFTSTVLGKRSRKELASVVEEQAQLEPDAKKARPSLLTATSTSPLNADDHSLTSTNRTMRSRAAKDKKYLTTGLYAGQLRSFDPALSESKNKTKTKTSDTDIDTNTDTSPGLPPKENSVLPLPMFAGARLLATGRDFRLPFDIFSPLSNHQGQSSKSKPDDWKRINKNIFVGDALDHWRPTNSTFAEHSTCVCSPTTGCDANCLNRFMYYECDSRNCNLTEDQCGNRAFEALRKRVKKGGKYNIGVEVLRTKDRGNGVRSNRCFDEGQIIVEYTGEIVTQEECESRMRGVYKDNECYYLMAFDQNMVIDATRGSIARFVNHSCDPNCRMEKWTVGGKPRMALFAGDSGIMTGEELTYDYNFDPYSQKNVQVCRCGSANCRGVLGPRPKDVVTKEKAEGKLAGAKRKLVEVLEDGRDSLLNKKRKIGTDKEKPRLPKGWAYVEPVVTKAVKKQKTILETASLIDVQQQKEEKENNVDNDTKDDPSKNDGKLSRQPSKLKKMLSQRSSKSVVSISKTGRNGSQRIVSTTSETALIVSGDGESMAADDRPTSSAVASLKAKAGSLKRSVGRSLRGGGGRL